MSRIDHLYWDEAWEGEPLKPRFSKAVNRKSQSSKSTSKSNERWLLDCDHWRQSFKLKAGLAVFASAWMDRPDRQRLLNSEGFEGPADIGFYLDPRWGSDHLLVSPGWNPPFARRATASGIVIFPWPDYGTPRDMKLLKTSLRWLLREVGRGKIIEIGCMGGHGRTGTVLALLLVLQGVSPTQACRQVWKRYCSEAIESQRQIEFIQSFK
jgi:hypothetical protein